VIAHIGGVPGEQLIPTAVGAGTALLVASTWCRCIRDADEDPGRGGDAETPLPVGLG
jgi:hypothetical protein